MHGFDDPFVSTASAQVIFQCLQHFSVRGPLVASQQTISGQYHTGRAVATLEGIVLHERLLKGMKFAIPRQTFNRRNRLPLDPLYRKHAGPNSHIVNQNCARPTVPLTTPVLGPRKPEVSAQHPQQRAVAVEGHGSGIPVEREADNLFHGMVPPLPVFYRRVTDFYSICLCPSLFQDNGTSKLGDEILTQGKRKVTLA